MKVRGRVSARRQQFAAAYVLPSSVADGVRGRLADRAATGTVLRGLRQWLRLRILTDEPMGMPSLAVQFALEQFLACPEAVNSFRRGVDGTVRSRHWTFDGITPGEAAAPTMALTWAMACGDQHERPVAPAELPSLFAADESLPAGSGWRWTMYCRHEPCRSPDHCVHHDLLPHLPDSIPHQVHFDLRPPHRLIDKSDGLFSPGGYGSSTFGQ